jgi:hypothetical protein
MLRPLRLAFLFLTLLFAASSAKVGQMPIPRQDVRIALHAAPLSNELNQLRQTGDLIYLGGWIMKARQPDFGGWSAMQRTATGLKLISDAGAVLDMPLPQGPAVRGSIAELPRGCGKHWNKEMHDSESMARDPATGRIWVGLEKLNRICRIDADGRAHEIARREMAKWDISYGAESMVRLRDGRFLVIAERDPTDSRKAAPVLVFDGDPVLPTSRSYEARLARPPGYLPVDAAELPDGRLLVLYRLFSARQWFKTQLLIFDMKRLAPGKLLTGKEIARLGAPVLTDNFEALAVEQQKRRTIIWLASDDNFWPLQQSYLLKFSLKD